MLRGESSGRPDDNIESLKKRYVSNRILNAFPLVIHWVLKKCCLWIVFNFPFLNDFHYMYVAYEAQYYFSIQSLIQTFSFSSWISPAYSCSAKTIITGLCKNKTKQIKTNYYWTEGNSFSLGSVLSVVPKMVCVSGNFFRVLCKRNSCISCFYGILCSLIPWAVGIVCALLSYSFAIILSDPAYAVLGR